jgi:hypothetical protein
MDRSWLCVQLLRGQGVGRPELRFSVLRGQQRFRAQLGVPLLHDVWIFFPFG